MNNPVVRQSAVSKPLDGATTGADGLAQALLDHGISTIYALPGAQIDQLFASLYDLRGAIRVVTSRHEQGAGYMAFGHARSTGTPGVFAVVPGPGWLNAGAAQATAFGCCAPVLCLSGQIPLPSIGQGYGELHELPDQLAMARGITKWARRIERPETTAGIVAEAFQAMMSGPRRPAYIEMPLDVMGALAPVDRRAPLPVETLAPGPSAIDQAADVLAKAERPLIFVGGGAQDASAGVTELARLLRAPVIAMRSGRGVLTDRDELSLPFVCGHQLWRGADVVLGIGTRLDFPRRQWGMDADLKIIRIDADSSQMTRVSRADIALVGDAGATTKLLVAALRGRTPRSRARTENFAEMKSMAIAEMDAAMAPQMAFLRAIRDVLPEDGFFVDELTQVGYASWSYFPTYLPRHFVSCGYQGTLGYGFPTSLGVKAANPDRAVVSVSGDGGFLFGASELASAVQHGLAVTAIVFRDNTFGNVQRIQKERYGGRVFGSDLHNPDFVALARSYGVEAESSASPRELRAALDRSLASGKPTLIEVPVGQLPSPWPFIVRPPVRPVQQTTRTQF